MFLLLDPEARAVVAHRGDSAHAPENTLESLRRGVSLGADALECDVHFTRDGHVVVIHDPTVDRTTNGAGTVADLTLAELQRLDAGFRFTGDGGRTFPWRGRGVCIPTLEELLGSLPGIPLIIEVKAAAAATATRLLLERTGAAARCLIGSFLADALAPFLGSGIARTASRDEVLRLYLRALLPGGPRSLPFQALCIPPFSNGIPLPVLRFARMARAAGIPTLVWTVDDPARARRYWDGGVSSIITNDPAVILAAAGRGPVSPFPSPV
jgi:glycerophosphoryl diester phosphodiesterase